MVPPPSLHPGGQARPREEGLGSRGRYSPGSPCSPLRPGRPGRPGAPGAPAFPSGARHTSWVTVKVRDVASTQTTSQPHGASMMPLWRHGPEWASHPHTHPTHTLEPYAHNVLYTSPHHRGTYTPSRAFEVCLPPSSRDPAHIRRTRNLPRYTHTHTHTHTHTQLSTPTQLHTQTHKHSLSSHTCTPRQANSKSTACSWKHKPTPK